MTRMMRFGVLAFVFAILALPLTVEARQDSKLARIGYLSLSSAEGDKVRVDAFRQGLRELGYTEGKNVVIEWRYAVAQPARLLEMAEELVRLKVDVLVVYGRVDLVKKVTSTIPIVFTVSADPVGTGLELQASAARSSRCFAPAGER